MTDVLNNCPRCGHAFGHCTHTTQGEITIVPAYEQLAAQYASTSFSNAHREEVRVALGLQSLSPTSPQPADTAIVSSPVLAAAGVADSIRQALYAPACAVCVVLELEASKERIASISEAMTRAAIKAAEASRADTGSAQS